LARGWDIGIINGRVYRAISVGIYAMKTILSYGAGVNSTAIIALALLGKIPMPDYIVFSDTGAEWPNTYQYMDYLECRGIPITYLTGGNKEMTLIDYCREKNFIPSRMNRWCTDYWKIQPVKLFAQSLGEDVRTIIGIDAGEAHRAKSKRGRQSHKHYLLIELGYDRNDCKRIIKEAGLGLPQKSGCYICPYQSKRQWIDLKREHPDLWEIAVDLENHSVLKWENFTYINGIRIGDYIADLDKQKVLDLFEYEESCWCVFN